MEGVYMQVQAISNNVEFGKSKARKAREAMIRQQEDVMTKLSDKSLFKVLQFKQTIKNISRFLTV